MAALQFLQLAPRLARQTPLRQVRLERAGGHAARPAASRHLARIASLDLSHNDFGPVEGPDDVAALAASGHPAGLRGLILCNDGVDDDGAAALADPQTLRQLTRLDLFLDVIGCRGAAAL